MTLRMKSAEPAGLFSVQPEGWPRPKGYSNGVRVPAGRDLLFVAGQIGWNAQAEFETDVFAEQFEQALRNCLAVVEAAGGSAADVVRFTMFCTDKAVYMEQIAAVGEAYRRVMGKQFPSMSLVEVAALLEARAQIEIEATAALLPSEGTD
jgi:enamine deaminase RidA (YjgF/YER057c/UK114 family)